MLTSPISIVTRSSSAIAHTSKYMTVAGGGQTHYFRPDAAARLPFIALGLQSALALNMYTALVFHASVPGVKFNDGADTLGSLNCVHMTVFPEASTSPMPFCGNFEMVSSNHRLQKEVLISLWNADRRALYAARLTGHRHAEDMPRQFIDDGYNPLQVPNDIYDGPIKFGDPLPSYEASPLRSLFDGRNIVCTCVLPSSSNALVYGLVEELPSVPQWVLLDIIQQFSTAIASSRMSSMKSLRISASKYITVDEVMFGVPFDVVSTKMRIYTKGWPIPSWDSELGMPSLPPQTTCFALQLDIRQHGAKKLSGTFYFTYS